MRTAAIAAVCDSSHLCVPHVCGYHGKYVIRFGSTAASCACSPMAMVLSL